MQTTIGRSGVAVPACVLWFAYFSVIEGFEKMLAIGGTQKYGARHPVERPKS